MPSCILCLWPLTDDELSPSLVCIVIGDSGDVSAQFTINGNDTDSSDSGDTPAASSASASATQTDDGFSSVAVPSATTTD